MKDLEEMESGYIASFMQYILYIIFKWHIYELIWEKLEGGQRIMMPRESKLITDSCKVTERKMQHRE